MFLQSDLTYQIGKNALDVSSMRQQTIAHNIANATTANYKSKQVEFEETLKTALGKSNKTKMKTTHSRHIGVTPSSAGDVIGTVYETNENSKMNLDGNNVDIDLEMANMAANQLQYSVLVQNINQKISDYRQVIKG